jgi:hypothetical protein
MMATGKTGYLLCLLERARRKEAKNTASGGKLRGIEPIDMEQKGVLGEFLLPL